MITRLDDLNRGSSRWKGLARGSDYSGALTPEVTIQSKVVLGLACCYVIAVKLYELPNEEKPISRCSRGVVECDAVRSDYTRKVTLSVE